MASETYLLADFVNLDIPGVIDLTLLTTEINDSSISSAVLQEIAYDSDAGECDIIFDNVLSSPDKTILDGLVAAHTGTPPDAPAPGEDPPQDASSKIALRDEGVDVTNTPHNLLNFIGASISVADAGNGVADITVTAGGGGGDVTGPASATDNAITRYDGTTGKILQDSLATLDDVGRIVAKLLKIEPVAVGTTDHVSLEVSQATGDPFSLGVDAGDPGRVITTTQDGSYRQATVMAADGSGTSTIFGVASSIDGGSSWSPSIVATQNNRVGISKINPSEALDVNGNIAVSGTIDGRDIDADGSALDAVVLSEANAIHDNVAGEIAAITEKASPISADLLIIEDSAAGNAKKKVQIGNLPGGGGSGDVVGPGSSTNNAVALFDGTTGKLLKNSNITVTSGADTKINAQASSDLLLHLDTDNSYVSRIRLTEEDSFRGGYISYNAAPNEFWLGVHDPADTNLANDTNAIFINRSNGYVGIGTNTVPEILSVGGNISVSGMVDGRDVAADGTAQDNHIASTNNPHSTDLGNLGTGTLSELNATLTDAVLDDISGQRDANKIQTRNIAATAPADGQALVWNNSLTQWEPGTVSGGGGGDVSAAANITDNAVVRGDGGAKGVQDSGVLIDDSNNVTGLNTLLVGPGGTLPSNYAAAIRGPSSGNGLFISAGENEGDILFHVEDQDGSLIFAEAHADDGQWTFGKTYAQTVTDNGTAYGIDLQWSSGVQTDFNTQNGIYRIGGNRLNAAMTVVNTNTQDFTGTTTIDFDSEDLNTDTAVLDFDFTNNEVDILKTGVYLVSYNLFVYVISNSRTQGQSWLELNTGGGFSTIVGTQGGLYCRLTNHGATGSALRVLSLNAGDTIRLRAMRTDGSGTLRVDDNGACLTVMRIS